MHRSATAQRLRRGLLRGTAALVLVVPALAGCSAGGDEAAPDAAEQSTPAAQASAAAEERPYLPVPDGVELTTQGVDLPFDETATVAWQPRTTTVGALEVTVDAVQRAPLSVFEGWRLDKRTRESAPYFVRATVANVGDSGLAGLPIPIYLVDETDTLIQASTFASRFTPCPSGPFPRGFEPGEEISTCLVYLVPDGGDAVAVSFRPSQEFDPITWTGEESTYDPARAAKAKQRQQAKQQRAQKRKQQDQQQ